MGHEKTSMYNTFFPMGGKIGCEFICKISTKRKVVRFEIVQVLPSLARSLGLVS